MPGAYAHITMAFRSVNPQDLATMGLDTVLAGKLMQQVGYFQLGAVSPDMPYLVGLGDNPEAIAWADCMHQRFVAERIGAGVAAVAALQGDTKIKCLAWLLGFVEHVVFDVFLHPVVNVIAGGEYKESTKARHQECEMHQDVHIVQREFNITDICDGNIVKAVVSNLHAAFSRSAIDDEIRAVWESMLQKSSPDLYTTNKPDIDEWYRSFISKMKMQEGSSVLVPLGRHAGWGLIYPSVASLKNEFLVDLKILPAGTTAYDLLFDAARDKVVAWWGRIVRAVNNQEPYDASWFAGWNLDTGFNSKGKLQFWS